MEATAETPTGACRGVRDGTERGYWATATHDPVRLTRSFFALNTAVIARL
jgi:hypothetical protein